MARRADRIRSVFGLKKLPFTCDLDGDLSAVPDTAQAGGYFVHPAFDEGLKRLRYVADRRGVATLIAHAGAGKSTLIRAFVQSLGKTAFHTAYVPETTCANIDLYRTIARAFQVDPPHRKAELIRRIKDRLLHLSRTRKICPVLVIDEAHLLSRTFFDELRILINFDADSREEMVLLLAGQPQLETSLRLGVNEAFAQRIVVRISLKAFSREEVQNYVQHRLNLAGRSAPLFTPDGIEALFKASQGVPRLIDRVAEISLLLALHQKRKEIDTDIVTNAVQEVEP